MGQTVCCASTCSFSPDVADLPQNKPTNSFHHRHQNKSVNDLLLKKMSTIVVIEKLEADYDSNDEDYLPDYKLKRLSQSP